MSNMRRVAKAAGVSVMTVSRYFNAPEVLAEETRERVERAISDLHYFPNQMARSLVRGTTDTIALIVSDVTNPFFTTLTRGVEDVLQRAKKTLILGNSDETPDKERTYLEVVVSRRTDGVILVPSSSDPHHLDLLRRHDIPVVLVDRRLPGAMVDEVRSDFVTGGRLLTEHLVAHGHERIAFIGGRADMISLHDRVSGYRQTMESAGLQPIAQPTSFDRKGGRQAVDMLMSATESSVPIPPFTAMVAANNYVAVGAVARLRALGWHVPEDVSIVSFDDFEVEAMVDPFFTVARQPAYEIGQLAAKRLLERLAGDTGPCEETVLPVTLVARHSVRTLKARSGDA